jgi:uncharacterized protein (DUF1697 family)
MPIYIAFLRGVNMTGHNSIKMKELAKMFSDLGFAGAETYIQSGNVVFPAGGHFSRETLAALIEENIRKSFGFDIPAMIRTPDELTAIVSNNPFRQLDQFDPSRMAAVFLHEPMTENQVSRMDGIDYPPDKYMLSGSEIYIYCPNGFGKTKLYTNFFENRMKVSGTARNWKTMAAIIDICNRKFREPSAG